MQYGIAHGELAEPMSYTFYTPARRSVSEGVIECQLKIAPSKRGSRSGEELDLLQRG